MKFGDAKPKVGNNDGARLEELVDLLKLPNGKWVQIRILPNDILAYRTHWVNILAGKTKREVKIPKLCVAFDPLTEETKKGVKCAYDGIEAQTSDAYLANVIVRSVQDEAPSKIRITPEEKKTGFKDISSNSWTPVKVARFTSSLMKKIQGLKELNKHTVKVKGVASKKTFHINDPKYGIDINIKYDEKAKGGDKYQVNLADKTPLTEEELAYLVYELTPDLLDKMGLETPEQAKKQLASMQIVGASEFDGDDEDEDEDDEDEDLPRKKGTKAPAKSKKKPVDEDEDDEDEDDEDEDEDDEEDDPPPSKKKPVKKASAKSAKSAKSKKKPVDDDEDDEDDEDEDDDEDDDIPF